MKIKCTCSSVTILCQGKRSQNDVYGVAIDPTADYHYLFIVNIQSYLLNSEVAGNPDIGHKYCNRQRNSSSVFVKQKVNDVLYLNHVNVNNTKSRNLTAMIFSQL